MPHDIYGVTVKDDSPGWQASLELKMCFNSHLWAASGFLGRYEHLKRAIHLIWNAPRQKYFEERRLKFDERINNAFVFNDWSEAVLSALCEGHWSTTIGGPNASGKTVAVALFLLCAFLANPTNTAVVLTTTSLPGLRKRIWKEVLRYWRMSNSGIGFVNSSDFVLRFQKGSDDSGLFGFATGQDEGDIQKAEQRIIGFHNKYVYAFCDELQATNFAIVKGCLSLEAGAEHFQFIGAGNPDSELDSLGQMSEPVDGWDSVTPESDRWKTKQGIHIHLDGLDSPRVREGDEFYPGLLRQRDIDSAANQYGEDSPEFWRTRRGFIAPQGVTKTVLSPSIINKFKAREKAVWVSDFTMGAGLDPAFEGGDRCILRFGKCGLMTDGKVGIELCERVQIKTSATATEPIHFQIARQVKELCEHHDPPVAPENMGIDSTGEGGALASILQREWSPAITQVEFGGRASDAPVSEFNPEPCHKHYLYKVTELWFNVKMLVQNGQLRGLDNETAIEFCQRIYSMRGNLIMIESKTDMKKRSRKSPDDADAVSVLIFMFKTTQNLSNGEASPAQTDDHWEKFRRQQAALLDAEHAYLMEA